MPANPKYLTKSSWKRTAKITAAILGGYLVSTSAHLAIACWINPINVIITMTITGFLLWAILMIIAFMVENAWKIWLLYLSLTIVFSAIIYFSKFYPAAG